MTIVIASDLSEVPSKDDIVKQMPRSALRELSDDELLRRLSALLSQSRRIEWALVAHIGEVEERRLFAREACDSMFVYCTEVLHLSEHEAYLRIAAARAAREHPVLLAMLGDGRLHLSGIAKLAPHLTPGEPGCPARACDSQVETADRGPRSGFGTAAGRSGADPEAAGSRAHNRRGFLRDSVR